MIGTLLRKKNIYRIYNIESLESESTWKLYQNKLTNKWKQYNVTINWEAESCWLKIKDGKKQAAEDAVGKRKLRKIRKAALSQGLSGSKGTTERTRANLS